MTPEELRKIRKRLDLTQTELAKIMEVTTNAVQNWEYGKRKISKTTAVYVKNLQLDQQQKDSINSSLNQLGDAADDFMTMDMVMQQNIKKAVQEEGKVLKEELLNMIQAMKLENSEKFNVINQNIMSLLRMKMDTDNKENGKDDVLKNIS